MSNELYQILEIMPGASSAEVKKNYYKLVKKYSPDNSPEQFKLIRQAYEVLSDPTARQDYDALQQYGQEIALLSNEAEEQMSQKSWESAISIWKRILVLHPNANGARHMLGLCYINKQSWDDALKIYQRLVRDNPDEPSYYLHYGFVLSMYAENLDIYHPTRYQFWENAREQFKKSIDLEPFNSQPYLEISRTYTVENRFDQALHWAEQAVGADGKIDFYDFDALFSICIIHLRSGQLSRIDEVSQRIIDLIPKDNDNLRQFVAGKFAEVGHELGRHGFDNGNFEALKSANFFLTTAIKFDPNNEEIHNLKQIVDAFTQAHDLLALLYVDSQIPNEFYHLSIFCLNLCLNQNFENKDNIFANIQEKILGFTPEDILTSLKKIREQYHPIYRLNPSIFDFFEKTAQQKIKSKSLPNKLTLTLLVSGSAIIIFSFFIGQSWLFITGIVMACTGIVMVWVPRIIDSLKNRVT